LAGAQGANWPAKPITLIVPFPPGGVTDLVARELARHLTEGLGQSVVVENRAGAGGNIGTASLAKASPDGHTLGVMTVSAISIAPHIHKSLSFNPSRDFTPITNIVNTPGAVLAGVKTPYNTLPEMIAAAKAQPNKITYASVGQGSLPHLIAEKLAADAGIKLTHVPYKGAAPAMQDLLANVSVYRLEARWPTRLQIFRRAGSRCWPPPVRCVCPFSPTSQPWLNQATRALWRKAGSASLGRRVCPRLS